MIYPATQTGSDMTTYIIGAGLWGLTMARLIAEKLEQPVVVYEKRDVPGGNSHSTVDESTGIECHTYGSHIFHTSNLKVWEFISRFTGFNTYKHMVLARTRDRIYPLPINLLTISQIYGMHLSPDGAANLLECEAAVENIKNPKNLEEKAISQIGRRLYSIFVKNYTAKQWSKDPTELPENIINRLPIRFNYNFNYFSDCYQGIPKKGYHSMFKKMMEHPLIEVHYGMDISMEDIRRLTPGSQIFYTGMPDELFGYEFGPLEWRSLRFEWERHQVKDFQGNSVVNYVDAEVPFTRVHEFKHYTPEKHDVFDASETILCREYPQDWRPGEEAYYPVQSENSLIRYKLYAGRAAESGIILGGRLGRFKYLDMDKTILDAMDCYGHIFNKNDYSNLICAES